MTLKRRNVLAISATTAIAILAANVPQASAQTLMDLLRGNTRRPEPVQVAPPPPPQPVAPPRVKGPSYYTYKTDSLVRVDFSAIQPVRDPAHAALEQENVDLQPVGSTQAVAREDEELIEAVEAVLEEDDEAPNEATTASPDAATQDTAADDEEAPTATATGDVPADPAAPVEEVQSAEPLTDAQIAALQDFELVAEKEAAEAIVAYYSQHPDFVWVDNGAPNDAARAAIRTLADAATHGLNPADYSVALPSEDDDRALAAFEMELSARILRYARDARSGRVDPNRISGYHDFEPKALDRVALLGEAAASEDIASLLEGQHPGNPRYKALRAELAELRRSAENDIVVEPNTVIRPGETNAELPKLLTLIERQAGDAFRAEHGELLTRSLGTELYSQELVPLIKAAQSAAGVGDDGIVGPRTIQAIAGDSKAARIEKVEIAMERLRWLPSDLTDRYVFINTPAFEATYIEDGAEKLSMRTVVGGQGTQTYFFQDEIEYVEFHPYWGVPRSILVNKYLPKLYSDPSYLDRNGFEVVNSRGQTVSSSSVNWGQYGANIPFDVRQKPGGGNALGEMKIMFPNRHAIYMHDTPDKHLFDRENRALSNGCVRLADPRAMAAAVLGWDRSDIVARLEQPHSRENLSKKMPVYVSYFTAWPTQAGEVEYYNDTYGRDAKMRAAIDKVDAVRVSGV
ncbi:L,D-transpeptidase family protein [Mesorhizobium sp. CAU 1741]|uniref:L,D-transpeptidase family protein n=1 Tax=Mesorhizobium sp. CAU 1741 TaxID=3140366 RepID=UPI00325A4A44